MRAHHGPRRHQEERTFLDEGGVFVSNARVEIGGKTYATANVTSVSRGVIPASKGCAVLILVVGVIGTLVGLTTLKSGAGVLVPALVVVAVAILWLISLKPTHTVRLTSASGEVDALSSKDQEAVDSVVDAIRSAIVYRG